MALPEDYEGGAFQSLKDSLAFERERVASWRKFRERTGRWPTASIVFHYSLLAVFLISLLAFFYFLDTRDWDWRDLVAGGAWLGFVAILWVFGGDIISRIERKRLSA